MSTKKELAEVRDQNKELRRTLARLAPSGESKAPDRVWKLLAQYADHFRYLASMSSPLQSRSVGVMTRHGSHKEPVGAGTWTSNHRGDRSIQHGGRPFEQEANRLYRQLQGLLSQSDAWVKGHDLLPTPAPSSLRPRCQCGELQAISWRWCPHCGRERIEETG